jgi:hypothetical protein
VDGLFFWKWPFERVKKQPVLRPVEEEGEKNVTFIFKKINSLWKTCEKK